MKKFISVLLVTMLFAIPAFATDASPSSWAEEGVSKALALDFVPDDLIWDYQRPITRIEFAETAQHFVCLQYHFVPSWYGIGLLLNAYGDHHLSPIGQPYNRAVFYPDYDPALSPPLEKFSWSSLYTGGGFFTDCQDFDAQEGVYRWSYTAHTAARAKFFGIAEGYGDGTFCPHSGISRQEAAVMLANTYRVYDGVYPDEIQLPAFQDQDAIADWAKAAISNMVAMGIMEGVGDNRFDPQGSYTVEQCIVTFQRLYEKAPTSRAKDNIVPLRTYEETKAELYLTDNETLIDFEEEGDGYWIVGGFYNDGSFHVINYSYVFVLWKEGGYYSIPIPFTPILSASLDRGSNMLFMEGEDGREACLNVMTQDAQFNFDPTTLYPYDFW